MTARETIQTWKWRLTKAGYTQVSFAANHDIKIETLRAYLNGKITPSLDAFDRIEGILKDLGV